MARQAKLVEQGVVDAGKPAGMGNDYDKQETDEAMSSGLMSSLLRATSENGLTPQPSVLVTRAELVGKRPQEARLIAQAHSAFQQAEMPKQKTDHGDIPVAAFIDDVKRKHKLKKVMGHGDKKDRKAGHALPAEADDKNVVDGGPTLDKELVNYRYSGMKGKMCQDCSMFDGKAGCTLVIGIIRPVDTCDRFEPNSTQAVAPQDPTKPARAELVTESEAELHTLKSYKRMKLRMEADGDFEADPIMSEVSPPGWEGTILRMKKHPEIDNPYALAWYMKNQGYTPHAGPRGGKGEAEAIEAIFVKPEGPKSAHSQEGGPGSGPQAGAMRRRTGQYTYSKDRPCKNCGEQLGKHMAEYPHDLDDGEKQCTGFKPGKASEGGPGSGPRPSGRSKFAPDSHDDQDSATATFTRRENPRQRAARIKKKPVDPATAAAIRRALMSARESVLVRRAR